MNPTQKPGKKEDEDSPNKSRGWFGLGGGDSSEDEKKKKKKPQRKKDEEEEDEEGKPGPGGKVNLAVNVKRAGTP